MGDKSTPSWGYNERGRLDLGHKRSRVGALYCRECVQ